MGGGRVGGGRVDGGRVKTWLTAQQKDERRQDNGDKKGLVRHHARDLLCLLTRERIGGVQHGIVSPAL